MNKCVFLDRDGVLNVERGEYTFLLEDFRIEEGVAEALKMLKKAGYLLIVITNQAGISRKLYTKEQMQACHNFLYEECPEIDGIYYSPYHDTITKSLTRKPDSLLFERAIAKYKVDPVQSWMVGDKTRDLIPAVKLGIKTILITEEDVSDKVIPDFIAQNLLEAARYILYKT